MIRFWCQCGRQLKAAERAAGEVAQCPLCRRMTIVPEADQTRTADWPPVPPRGAIGPNGEITRRSAGPTTAVIVGEAALERKEHVAPPSSRLPRIARLLVGLSLVLNAAAFVGLCFVIARWDWATEQGQEIYATFAILSVAGSVLGMIVSLLSPSKRQVTVPFALGCIGLLGTPFFALNWETVLTATARMKETSKLKQIGMATHNYAAEHENTLPASEAFRTKEGKPGLSWRVALLPYVEHDDLYKQFKLDEPWDSPNNIRLLDKMPYLYHRPGQKQGSGMTHYQVFVGPKTPFEPNVRVRLNSAEGVFDGIPDGTSNTLLVVVARDPVPWTKPDDLDYDPNKPLPVLSPVSKRANPLVLMADGSVRALGKDTPEATIRALITRNGGEAITLP